MTSQKVRSMCALQRRERSTRILASWALSTVASRVGISVFRGHATRTGLYVSNAHVEVDVQCQAIHDLALTIRLRWVPVWDALLPAPSGLSRLSHASGDQLKSKGGQQGGRVVFHLASS